MPSAACRRSPRVPRCPVVERVRITPLERVRITNLPAVAEPRVQKFGEAGPGRPLGSRNLMPQRVARLVLESLDQLGNDGKGEGGVMGYLRKLFWDYPQFAASMLHKMVPAQVQALVVEESTVEHTHTHRVDPDQLARLTTDELAGLYRAAVQAPVGGVEEPRGTAH